MMPVTCDAGWRAYWSQTINDGSVATFVSPLARCVCDKYFDDFDKLACDQCCSLFDEKNVLNVSNGINAFHKRGVRVSGLAVFVTPVTFILFFLKF